MLHRLLVGATLRRACRPLAGAAPSRGLIEIPAMVAAALAGSGGGVAAATAAGTTAAVKLVGALGLQKVVAAAVIKRLGPAKTVELLRYTNASLATSPATARVYTAATRQAVDEKIDRMEQGLALMRTHEQVDRVWRAFDALDKAPNGSPLRLFLGAILRVYIEQLAPFKVASALLGGPPPANAPAHLPASLANFEEEMRLRMEPSYPELVEFDVVLIRRANATNKALRETQRGQNPN
ncbi:hypothetical protein T492DRAFT_1074482 [Pavlovales sp. CCMP2436]|nr:hypothetical protein T492DRAFT_1074482 [Pavlovales sp. CCMP2436]|mmetsp:Transcript_45984/g.107396  ORF Transcript_45984/g.107396 Transcript_45984/m.107396 type:complete len:238 (-) Transcript_45984:12-725(-)